MTPQRFAELAQAYGSDIARWPDSARVPARRELAQTPSLQAVLADAAALDGWLDDCVAPALPGLADRVLAAAPTPGRVSRARLRRWLAGAGAVGVLGAGAAVGMALVTLGGAAPGERDGWGGLYDPSGVSDIAVLDAAPHGGARG